MNQKLNRREVLAAAATAAAASALPNLPVVPKPAWLAAAEAEIAANPWAAWPLLRGMPLTVVANAAEAGRDPLPYPNLFAGFAGLLRDGLAALGSDGRLRITEAGREAEHAAWLDGW
jgi:hypothetical protein